MTQVAVGFILALLVTTLEGAGPEPTQSRPPTLERNSTLSAVRTASVEGVVVSEESGVPVAGALVTLSLPKGAAEILRLTGELPDAIEPVTTDARGRFSLAGLRGGDYEWTVRYEGYIAENAGQIRVAPEQQVSNVVLRLTPYRPLQGLVRDEAGQPVADVPVQLLQFQAARRTSLSGKSLKVVATQTSRSDGSFQFDPLAPGDYLLTAASPLNSDGHLSAAVFSPVTLSATGTTPLDLTLAPERSYRIRGAINRDNSGKTPTVVEWTVSSRAPLNEDAGPSELRPQVSVNRATGELQASGLIPGVYIFQYEFAPGLCGRQTVIVPERGASGIVASSTSCNAASKP
ncbi:MAG TPA: carboxypeptidase-like regulatory domain-containing protein [Terriglobia bacterium]|nr:carboxypeptidase-like regulatory domain-containing protein [Terriglobia bacterium]